LELVG